MRTINYSLKMIVLLSLIFLFSSSAIGQETDNDYATIKFYRPKKPAIMHTGAFGVRIFVDEKEIGILYENATMEYRIYEGDSVNIKCMGNFANGRVGNAYVTKLKIEKGKESHLALSILMLTFSIKGEVLEEGIRRDEILKKKYIETTIIDERELKNEKAKQESAKIGKSKSERLKELKQLLNDEIITQEEYNEARKKIINE